MKKLSILFCIMAWLIISSFGFGKLLNYEAGPGAPGDPPEVWPTVSQLKKSLDKPTLLFFAHPRCPCTKASLTELAEILAHVQDKVTVNIIFYKPQKFGLNWVRGSLYERAINLGVDHTVVDSSGVEIENFKPKTSGQVYLYSKTGDLIYSGGITASRGHEGDNLGSSRILNYILENKAIEKKFSVYGCSLFHNGHMNRDGGSRGIGSFSHEH